VNDSAAGFATSGAGGRGIGGIGDGGGGTAGVGRVGGGEDVALTACLEIGGVCVRGTAWMICVAASWMSSPFASSTGAPSSLACCDSQFGKSVNDVRKCVTTT
jgi:hypothetical protein